MLCELVFDPTGRAITDVGDFTPSVVLFICVGIVSTATAITNSRRRFGNSNFRSRTILTRKSIDDIPSDATRTVQKFPRDTQKTIKIARLTREVQKLDLQVRLRPS